MCSGPTLFPRAPSSSRAASTTQPERLGQKPVLPTWMLDCAELLMDEGQFERLTVSDQMFLPERRQEPLQTPQQRNAVWRPHPLADIGLDGLAVGTHRSIPSNHLVVEVVGREMPQLFGQKEGKPTLHCKLLLSGSFGTAKGCKNHKTQR